MSVCLVLVMLCYIACVLFAAPVLTHIDRCHGDHLHKSAITSNVSTIHNTANACHHGSVRTTGHLSRITNNTIYVKCATVYPRYAANSLNAELALVNTRAVRHKTDFMNVYVVDNHPDITALTETWLSPDDSADITALTAGGYNLWHLPRKTRRDGGVWLLYKSICNLVARVALITDSFDGLSATLQSP